MQQSAGGKHTFGSALVSLALCACGSAGEPQGEVHRDADALAVDGGDAQDDASSACHPVPEPVFVAGDRACGGLGFVAARVSIGNIEVQELPYPRDPFFIDRLSGWQPRTQGPTLAFALDGRSFSYRFVVHGPAATMRGVTGRLILSTSNGQQFVHTAQADQAGNLELALTEFGLGLHYELVLEGFPADACDTLEIELPCP